MTTTWMFRSRDYPAERWTEPLWLHGEIDGSPVVDNLSSSATGEEEVEYWREYVRRSDHDWWEADAVPVSWYIEGGSTFEASPDCPTKARFFGPDMEDFLTFYTWPVDVKTRQPLRSWDDLPRKYRFKGFDRAYGFVPPHTAFVPVRTWSPWAAQPLDSLGPSESCLRCGRPLSDPLSIDAGHGPWCARKALTP